MAAKSSTKDYKFEWVFYEAGLELKGDDKYGAYVLHIGNLLENIQLVDPLAIMHAVGESWGAKPLSSKLEMSTNMTVYWRMSRWGATQRLSNQKRITIGQRAGRAKMSLTPLILAYTQQWYSCRTLNQKSSSPTWHMNLAAQGDFIFRRSNSSAKN